ncbi:matrixin family metalloprotease [Fimbriimonas ginsengisoli]|uniref:Uncharacterized protein n=1 Tax=Fimbriimonas ginsengisoli Gsoil 348 TaxID=661478 RepID=A0A068NX59_FIMGI|nr:matrixin family metalloprotease [Fimbriimonas ginsengisoli]AIE88078.1 hypothetical protein OP10G_4710 [Fimbriimonas ginsengisoli Gsoil 348]
MNADRLGVALLLGALVTAAHADITIDNFEPGEVVRHPVVVLRGHAGGDSIAVGQSWANAGRTPVVKGEFRAIVELRPGPNMIVLQSGRDTMKYRIDYRPPTSPIKVLAIWVRAKDEPEDAYYYSPTGDRPRVREKFDTALKAIQCFYAEAMHDAGYGRKTFPLELDKNGKVVVHVLTVPKTGAEMRAMENNESWSYIYGLLSKEFPENDTHWCAMLGFSGYDRGTKKSPGHYALGGGSLGAFGTGSMSHWPASLKEIQKVMTDATLLDPNQTFDDSAFRRTVWANVSTAWGAMAHEMGHTFGLPHSNDPFSVMSRGFDYVNRTFVVEEAPRAGVDHWVAVKPDEHSRWDKYSAAKLNWNPYFQPDLVRDTTSAAPSIRVDGDQVVITAASGIRVWGADRDDTTPVFSEFLKDAPTEVTTSLKELREKFKSPYRITVVDTAGRQVTIDEKGQ